MTEDVVGGNIVINGGNITANGGGGGAGIGAGVTKDPNNSSSRKAIVGTITIAGGSVTAVGGSNADGIGAGQNNYNATIQIGTVTIYDAIDKVDASSIKDFASVVYKHGETNVTTSKANYFNIVEDGNRRIITPPHTHNFTYSATGATITATCSNDCPLTDHKATLTIAAPTGNLTYDGTAKAATLTGLGTFNTATGLSIDESGITYYAANKNGNTYTKSGSALTDAPTGAGDYVAEITVQSKTASVGYTITPRPVIIKDLSASNKEYDGTTTATTTGTATIDGKVGSDDVSVSAGTASFADANVGTGKTVTFSGYSLTGTAAGNYKLSAQPVSVTANINKKKLIISGITAQDKEYDGNTSATLNTANPSISGLVGSDKVKFTVVGAFTDAEKGSDKTVNLSGWTLTSGGSNYEIDNDNSQKTTTASITNVQVYISGITIKNKEYNGNTDASYEGTPALKRVKDNSTVDELTVSGITVRFNSKNAGKNIPVSITEGTISDTVSYTLMKDKTTGLKADITQKEVTLSWGTDTFTYDGNTHAPAATAGALIAGDACEVTVTGGQKNAGTYTAAASFLSNSNYKLPENNKKEYTINKATADVTAPTAKTGLTYNGSAQVLINAGSTTGGTLKYAAVKEGASAPAGSDYSASLPEAINAGNYTVYYRLDGGQNYYDTAVQSMADTVSIERKTHDKAELSENVRYGKSKTIDISEFIEPGGKIGNPVKEDNGVLSGVAKTDEKTIEFTAENDESIVGKTAMITVPVTGADNYKDYNIIVTVTCVEKYTQEISFAVPEVTLKSGETYTNELSGAKTPVSYKSSDEKAATVDSTGKVTAVDKGEAAITATAEETEDYFSAETTFTVTVEKGKADKVPFTASGEKYAAEDDNFAAETSSGKINNQVLDFSKVAESDVKPSDLKMTAISGSRFITKSKLKDKGSASATGGVKVKVNKKTLIPKITCKKDGSVTLTMEDGNTYTVSFKVQKPKAQKSAKSMSKGSSPTTKTIRDLFGTDIDAGELKILKQKHSQATLSGNLLMVDPREKDSIKVQYKYLNKKYKLTMKVK